MEMKIMLECHKKLNLPDFQFFNLVIIFMGSPTKVHLYLPLRFCKMEFLGPSHINFEITQRRSWIHRYLCKLEFSTNEGQFDSVLEHIRNDKNY